MYRKTPLIENEVYHVFNRGAHKRNIFTSEKDYARFKILLHLSNDTEPVRLSNIFEKYKKKSTANIFENETANHSLVDVLAYAFMPNHLHLILRQKRDGGITTFMKKVMTAYSMYFNIKYEHSGVLFQGRFKSSHVPNDEYLRYLFAYVHLNPLELEDPHWKEKGVSNKKRARDFLNAYTHSSYLDYKGSERPEKIILAADPILTFNAREDSFEELFELAKREPYSSIPSKDGPC